MFRAITRLTTPVVAGAVAFAAFPRSWAKSAWTDTRPSHHSEEAAAQIKRSTLYKELCNAPGVVQYSGSSHIPAQHHTNYVSLGLLFGPDLFEVDPVVFVDASTRELTSFYYLGDRLVSDDGQIHNGVTSTIMDEGLTQCGFPLLPSKRGVTASLAVDFRNPAPPRSVVVLRARVTAARGRKVVIEGTLQTLGESGVATEIAKAECVLVEPKWFKYLRWLQL